MGRLNTGNRKIKGKGFRGDVSNGEKQKRTEEMDKAGAEVHTGHLKWRRRKRMKNIHIYLYIYIKVMGWDARYLSPMSN